MILLILKGKQVRCLTCRAYSVSAMRRPARNAPRASERPARDVRNEVPSTTRRVVDAKISALANFGVRRGE